mgnify:CR=1 FL=1
MSILDLTALELGRQIRAGAVSVPEAGQASLERIAQVEPDLNAYVTVDGDRAMEQAGVTAAETAMLGDKLLTDMLAANRAGVLPLMVEPVGGAVTAWQKVLQALQAPFKAACRRKMEKKS